MEANPVSIQFNNSPDVVVAIDFGTTRSAFVIFLVHEQSTIHFRDWECGKNSLKGPTSLFYGPRDERGRRQVKACAYNAEEKSKQKGTGDDLFLSGFKMGLNHETIGDISVIDAVSDYLKFLKKNVSRLYSDTTNKNIENQTVRWCLTVPAIWTDPEKQKMAQAAYLAGLTHSEDATKTGELVIVLEPEAAAARFYLYSLHYLNLQGYEHQRIEAGIVRNLDTKFSDNNDKRAVEGILVLIVDAGGGTVDLTLNKCFGESMVEVKAAIGNKLGGNSINKKFLELIEMQFELEAIKLWKEKFPWQLQQVESAIEDTKLNLRSYQPTTIKIPISLANRPKSTNLGENTLQIEIDTEDHEAHVTFTENQVRNIYHETIEDAKHKVESFLGEFVTMEISSDSSRNVVDYVWLVGGFANCVFLQEAVKMVCMGKAFDKQKEQHVDIPVIVPPSPEAVVVEGAVHYGLNPDLIKSRQSRYTYGLMIMEKWDNERHGGSRVWCNRETGEDWCPNVFHLLAKKNETWEFEKCATIEVLPQYKCQRLLNLAFYMTENENIPQFVNSDDKDLELAGQIVITLPPATDNQPRKVMVDIFFGKSIVQARAYNKSKPEECYFTKLEGAKAIKLRYHVIFCIDYSLSMNSEEPCPDQSSIFQATHNNRLGAVFQACQRFLQLREIAKPFVTSHNNGDFDVYSMIKFNDYAEIVFEKKPVSDSYFVKKVLDIKPIGGTNYAHALECIQNKLIDSNYTTVIVFLSDGEDDGYMDTRNSFIHKILKSPSGVTLNTVHVGTHLGKDLLEKMSKKGGGIYIPVGGSLDDLLCAFELLAARLG